MNDDFKISLSAPADPEMPTMGMSSVYRLFEAFIALREKNQREHKLFEQTLNRARDGLQSSFNTFAGDTQKAISYLDQMLADEDSIDDLNDDKDLGPLLKTAPFAAWQKKRLAATRPDDP